MIDLQSFAHDCSIEIIRNAPFENVGLLLDRRKAVLAPFYDGRYLAELERNKGISMVLTTPSLLTLVPADRGVAICGDPLDSIYTLHCRLLEAGHYGASAANEIAPDARIHPTACIAERDVQIGAGTVIGPRAVIGERSIIGENCVIGAGTIIGAEGFEVRRAGGRRSVVPHGGGVRIGSHVTIQSNVVVDCALFGGFTEIGDDTVVGDLVHLAHTVSIGRRCRIAACAVVCGATIVGEDVWIGPNASVSSAISVGDGAQVSLGAVVIRDVPPGGRVSGNFAIDHKRFAMLFNSSLRE
jgi:acyl-[acyl carrier protein]--UDP-N-acetylglucosamine O-acyltransferase